MLLVLCCVICSIVQINGLRIIQDPGNETFCEGSSATLSCVIFDNSTNNAADTTSWFTNENPPAAINHNMINNTRNGDVVTSVLTIESVSLNDNGNRYFCVPSLDIESYVGVISVAGPSSNASNVTIPDDEIQACRFTVRWNEAQCGTITYTVTVINLQEEVVFTRTTSETNCNVNKQIDSNTNYTVNVMARNGNGGNGVVTMVTRTNSDGLPSIAPNITAVVSENSTCNVSWTLLDSAHNYIVRWINLNTTDMDNETVPGNITSYNITGLDIDVEYNITVTVIGVCGGPMESDNFTFNVAPPASNSTSSDNSSSYANISSDSERLDAVLIVIIVVVIAVVVLVTAALIVTVIAWRHYRKEKNAVSTIKHESDPNEYTEVNQLQLQENENSNDNLQYAYAITGRRNIAFSTEMPQNQ